MLLQIIRKLTACSKAQTKVHSHFSGCKLVTKHSLSLVIVNSSYTNPTTVR